MEALDLSPGVPLPNSDSLYQMLLGKVLKSRSHVDGSYLLDFLLGETKPPDPEIPHVKVLDYETFRKLMKVAKDRNFNKTITDIEAKIKEKNKHIFDKSINKTILNNTRRSDVYTVAENKNYLYLVGYYYYWDWYTFTGVKPEPADILKNITSSTHYSVDFMALMQQSIYQIQYNVKKTKFYRKKYKFDLNYKFALLYGMILESKDKIDALVNTMMNLCDRTSYGSALKGHKLLYYLNIYEKVLAATTDINYLVRHLMEMTRGIRESLQIAQKHAEPQDVNKRPELRRRRIPRRKNNIKKHVM